eukprot:Opistho-2@53785
MRWTRLIAWFSTAELNHGSSTNIRVAAVRLRPTPPLRRLTRKTWASVPQVNFSMTRSLSACERLPSSLKKTTSSIASACSTRSSIDVHCENTTHLCGCPSSRRASGEVFAFLPTPHSRRSLMSASIFADDFQTEAPHPLDNSLLLRQATSPAPLPTVRVGVVCGGGDPPAAADAFSLFERIESRSASSSTVTAVRQMGHTPNRSTIACMHSRHPTCRHGSTTGHSGGSRHMTHSTAPPSAPSPPPSASTLLSPRASDSASSLRLAIVLRAASTNAGAICSCEDPETNMDTSSSMSENTARDADRCPGAFPPALPPSRSAIMRGLSRNG